MPVQGSTTDLSRPALLALASLRERPDDDSVRAIAGGPLGDHLDATTGRAGLVELRDAGLARERNGRWHLTAAGHDRPVADGEPAPDCRIAIVRDGALATIRIAGRLDEAAAERLRDQVSGVVGADVAPEIVVLDLARVARIEPAGILAVADIDATGRRTGARVVVTGARAPVHRALRESVAGERLTFVRTLQWSA